ncbi:MAG: hypothetical protein HOH04_00335 [Rhodospirillaceae bacterium]|jgi:hypothetical protein|nr:hypothetical protein [Rhodospirillaceae bacterium]
MSQTKLSADGKTMTVSIPMSFTVRGGRKLVVSPDGSDWKKPRHRIDNTMVKALARAFRWQRLLESGQYATIEEIAKAEKINTSYISRILRLTLLSPEIVEKILDGRQPTDMTLKSLQKSFPVDWEEQREMLLTAD